MSVKINSLEIENVKRVKAVSLTPSENGLTVIGGKNGQGKTSVLDAIAWALGGDRFRPSSPAREGSVIPPHLKITLSNGIVVERKGKNSDLKVTDPSGKKNGQALLNSFITQFALDIPTFMQATDKEKARTLLQIIGVGEQLLALDTEEDKLYNERHYIGQIAEQKKHFADEMQEYDGVPEEPVSASELIRQQQEILARNGENQRKRAAKDRFARELEDAEAAFEAAQAKLAQARQNYEIANKDAEDLIDESTEELEANIREIDALNVKIRANLDKENAKEEAAAYSEKYKELSTRIEKIRADRTDLLNGAEMPLEGLSVDHGELVYNGAKWDCMSASEQMRVATAIVRKLNPECGFVLLDKLEQMDVDSLREFGAWLENEGLQAIATRVSTGGECSVVIQDGYILNDSEESVLTQNGGRF